MTAQTNGNDGRLTSIKRIGLTLTAMLLLYVIVGLWVVPPILKARLTEALSDRLGRPVTIGAVDINPLALSVTIADLAIHETDGAPFAGFAALDVNAQLSSIFRWAFTLKAVHLSAPFGTLRLMPGGATNIDDLIATFSQPAPPADTHADLPRALVAQLAVTDGRFTVENATGSTPIRDVIEPITFNLSNLSTLQGREGEYRFSGVGPIGGSFELRGKLALNPLRIDGSFTTADGPVSHYWEHIQDLVAFEIVNGIISSSGDYTVAIVDGRLNVALANGVFELKHFELTAKGAKEVLVDVPTLTVQGIGADLQARDITVAAVQTADARIRSWLAADGTFGLQQLFVPDLERLMAPTAAAEPDPDTIPVRPWRLALKKLNVVDWGVAFEDRTLTHPATLTMDDLDVVVDDLSNQRDARATVAVTMQINRAGRVKVDGTAGIDPLQADLTVAADQIGLQPFQPYADEAVNARIAGGSISSKGRVRYQGNDSGPRIQYAGDFSVDAVDIRDRVQSNDFITLAHLGAGGIVLDLLPNRLAVSEVRIDRPHARVTIDAAGVINVVDAFAPDNGDQKDRQANLLQRLVSFLILQFKGPMPIAVDRIGLAHFTADFVDASVSPVFRTHVEITDAAVTALSSAPSARADFQLNGSVDHTATIAAAGKMNPMNALLYSQVDYVLKDFALPPVSPYAAKFIGYTIADGTLNTELAYTVDDHQVQGDNVISIDRLELGEKVASPDVLNLPIKLGVALLKDADGRIRLQVPVVGNAKDPQFDVAATIRSALTGTIEAAGSAPFATIGEIDGFSGEQLRTMAFDAGSAALDERQTRQLNALATFLKARDDLVLGMVGSADPVIDAAALSGEAARDTSPTDDSPSERPSTTVDASDRSVDDARLEALARERTEVVRAFLVDQAAIDTARIRPKPVQIASTADGQGGRVDFSLMVQ